MNAENQVVDQVVETGEIEVVVVVDILRGVLVDGTTNAAEQMITITILTVLAGSFETLMEMIKDLALTVNTN